MKRNPRGAERIFLALDISDPETAVSLADRLSGDVGGFKIGHELFAAGGSALLRELKDRGMETFLDLKLHDIPNSIARASQKYARLGVSILTVHAQGGKDMMQQALIGAEAGAREAGRQRPTVLAVTVLTSLDDHDLEIILGYPCTVLDHVCRRALAAKEAGLDGVVASPREITAIRQICGKEFLIVTPGVRPKGSAKNDQKRIMSPGEAIGLGADYLVVGRPILSAPDPVSAARQIVAEIDS